MLSLSDLLDIYFSTHEKVVILSQFNIFTENNYIKTFRENSNIKSLIKQPACYKNPDNPTWIDLMLTNVPRSFESTKVLQTRLSDFPIFIG